MAEGWTRHLRGGLVQAWSAGVEKHGLNPHAVAVMAEAGVDISAHQSKLVTEIADIDFDVVVTVCDRAAATCPVFPGSVRTHPMHFDDPPALARAASSPDQALDHYRRVRDEIRDFVLTLPNALKPGQEEGL